MTFPQTQMDWGFRIACNHSAHLRHAYGLGWHVWQGTHWQPDLDGETVRMYENEVKDAYTELADLSTDERKIAFRSLQQAERKSNMDGALVFAAAQMAVGGGKLDLDRDLLNCANGTLDLSTMALSPHNPADNITKVCRGGWQADTHETHWSKFIGEILPDAEIRDFVQRLMGSALHGRVREHVLPIFTGTGGNGKSTFIETIQDALGGYGIQADPRLLMASAHDAHPTGQADLQSRRLAICMETQQGRRLDAPTAKQLTGGDTIRARRMRQDFFEFEPSHTIIMITNHKPVVSGSDEALWRRLVVVPFDQVFTDQKDPDLKDRLRAEPDAVLSWMVQGWLAYRAQGLGIPHGVRAATDAYKADSDAVGRFMDECVWAGARGTAVSGAVYAAWLKWCAANGEEAGSQKSFSEELTLRGYQKTKSHGQMVWKGFNLVISDNRESGEG